MTTLDPAPTRSAPRYIALRAEALSVLVDVVGARIASVVHVPSSVEFLLTTPWADEEWQGAFSAEQSSAEWHRRYPGGWHTLVPHAGDPRRVDGIDHPFHGEAAWRPWRVVAQDDTSLSLRIVLRTAPLSVERTVSIVAGRLNVRQVVRNMSSRPTSLSWTEHPAFGSALAAEQTRVTIGDTVVPPVQGTSGLTTELTAIGVARIENPLTGAFARLTWDAGLLPYAHVWHEYSGHDSFPWWGQVRALAVEPASRPYDADSERLGPITMAGHAVISADFGLEVGVDQEASAG